MKPVGRFSKLVPYAAVLVGGMLALSANAEMLINKAVVRASRGTAAYRASKGGEFKPVKVGMIFNPHTVIRTAPGSSVDLFLNENGPVVRVAEDTELGIDKLDLNRTGVEDIIETQLDLRSGRVLGNVKKMAAASKYEVKTPHGVAGIRGTEYDIRADGTVHVISGTVVVVYVDIQNPSNPTQTVTVTTGQTATPPVGPGKATIVQTLPGPVTTEANDVRQVTVDYTTKPNPVVPSDSPVRNPTPTPVVPPGPSLANNNPAGYVPNPNLHNTPEIDRPPVSRINP